MNVISDYYCTGCWFEFGYFDICAKIGRFYLNSTKPDLFERLHSRISDFTKKVLNFVSAKD